MAYYVDEHIKNTERVFPGQGRYGKKRYDMNENPEGLPKEFVDEVLKEITPEYLSIYPEPDRFLHKYADFIGNGVRFENLVAVNGSDMAIRYILETFGEEGKNVVTVSPSFEMYWVNCSILGLKHVPVAYEDDLTITADKILDAINEDTRIVVLLNPNNPVGNIYSRDDVERIIAKAKSCGAIVLIDEAYHYFCETTFLPYALSEGNVIILRTFSKLMSIAACRLGVVISDPQIIHYIKNAKLTFDANAIALLFAERLVERPDIVENLIKTEKEGKAYILKRLEEAGYWTKDCNGNFIFIKPKTDPHKLTKILEEKYDVLVHPYGNELLKDYIRVTTGSKRSMEIFLEAFLEADALV